MIEWMCVNPPGGRRTVPLNQDFFVSFGKTVLKPEEVVVSVFIPFSKKVKMVFSSATNNGGEILIPVTLVFLSGGDCSSFPTRSEEGGLFCHRDHWDESAFRRGIKCGS